MFANYFMFEYATQIILQCTFSKMKFCISFSLSFFQAIGRILYELRAIHLTKYPAVSIIR